MIAYAFFDDFFVLVGYFAIAKNSVGGNGFPDKFPVKQRVVIFVACQSGIGHIFFQVITVLSSVRRRYRTCSVGRYMG